MCRPLCSELFTLNSSNFAHSRIAEPNTERPVKSSTSPLLTQQEKKEKRNRFFVFFILRFNDATLRNGRSSSTLSLRFTTIKQLFKSLCSYKSCTEISSNNYMEYRQGWRPRLSVKHLTLAIKFLLIMQNTVSHDTLHFNVDKFYVRRQAINLLC